MFTLEQIEAIHARLGKAKTLLAYVLALRALGVARYDSYVTDGHSEYIGQDGQPVVSPPAHDRLIIAKAGDRKAVLAHLRRHEQGETTYTEMSCGLADSGIEKWTVNTGNTSMTYVGLAGNALLVEQLEEPGA